MLASLEETPDKNVLHDDDLLPLKIRVSDLPLEMESPVDFGPRFFTPFAREDLHTSACAFFSPPDDRIHERHPPPEDPGDLFYYDRNLAFNIDRHVSSCMFEYGSPWGWKEASRVFLQCVSLKFHSFFFVLNSLSYSLLTLLNRLDTRRYKGIRYGGGYMGGKHGENLWMVDVIVNRFSHRTPHLMLVMTSDHTGDAGLLRSEMVVMVSFMLSRFRSKGYRRHVVQPVSPSLPVFPV